MLAATVVGACGTEEEVAPIRPEDPPEDPPSLSCVPPRALDAGFTSLTVAGRVTDSHGQPVAGAVVLGVATMDQPFAECSLYRGELLRTTTGATGRYVTSWGLPGALGGGGTFGGCLSVSVEPPSTSGLSAATMDSIRVTFLSACDPAWPDTATVNVVLPRGDGKP